MTRRQRQQQQRFGVDRRTLGLVLAAVVMLAAALLWTFKPWQPAAQNGLVAGEIQLASTVGDFSLSDLDDDQLAVIFFGYTWCPDVCPMSLAVVRQARQALPEDQRRRVVPLMISVDPERDTLERLSEYLEAFGDDFIGATGSQAELADIGERYGVVWRKVETPESAVEYLVDHSASLYLVDAKGEIIERVLHAPTPGPLLAALDRALN
ncbi:SCO family protein [Halomonas litopenaei]|uniref:SCO family protein n=1 Tax=Halomonas litopenaei TaxID=2109328 RepID=UPI003F9F52E1